MVDDHALRTQRVKQLFRDFAVAYNSHRSEFSPGQRETMEKLSEVIRAIAKYVFKIEGELHPGV